MSAGNTTFGHFVGGSDVAATVGFSDYKILSYSTETFSTSASSTPDIIVNTASISNRVTTGYFSNIGYADWTAATTRTAKLFFPTQTFSTITSSVSTNVGGIYAFGADGGDSKGYIATGYDSRSPFAAQNILGKITYSTDTPSALSGLPDASALGVATANFTTAAYCIPGFSNFDGAPPLATAYKITYSTDASSTVASAALNEAAAGVSSVYNNSVSGYFFGGVRTPSSPAAYYNYCNKLNFSTEVSALVIPACLSKGLYRTQGASSADTGYVFGGLDKGLPYPYIAQITSKLDFATDITSVSGSAELKFLRYGAGVVSQTIGYVGEVGNGYAYISGDGDAGIKYIRITMNGVVTIGGSAPARSKSIASVGGTITISGSAPAQQQYVQHVIGAGTVTVGGAASCRGPVYGTGTVVISGSSPFSVDYIYTGTGTIVIGSATPIAQKYYFTGSGSVVISGTATPILDYIVTVTMPYNYAVLAKVEKSMAFNYAVGQVTTFAYRVQSDCTVVNGQNCNARYLNLVFATSIEGVCTELKRQGWRYPIGSLKKYTKPVYKSEELALVEKGLYDPSSVPEYVEVPFCQEPACYDFCVKYAVEERSANLVMYGGTGPSFVTGSGTVYTYGSALVRLASALRTYFPNAAASPVTITGSAPVTTTDVAVTTYYTGSGYITITGTNQIVNNLGERDMLFTGRMSLEEFTPSYTTPSNFEITSGDQIAPQNSTTNINQCNCINLSRRLSLLTNLSTDSDFTSFLNRNGYTFDPDLVCYYNDFSASYGYSSHFKGVGSNSSGISTGLAQPETWTLSFDINCSNDLDNFDDDKIWVLNFYVQRKTLYAGTTYKTLDCNLQIWMPSALFCPVNKNRQITFSLQINTQTKTCLVNGQTLLQNVFLNDQIGLFSSVGWLSSPVLTIDGRSTL